MAVIVTPQDKIDAYYASTNLSQSILKELQYGLDKFLETQRKRQEDTSDKSYFIIGGGVDTILTAGEEFFDQKYYVSSLINKPSEMEMNIIKFAFDGIVSTLGANADEIGSFEEYSDFVHASIENHGWQPKWKTETKISKIIEVGTTYFEDLKACMGKTVISASQKEIIDNIVRSLRTNSRTSKYFDTTYLNSAENNSIDIYYQLPLYFKKDDIDCKALLDFLVIVKDVTGTVVALEPIDLKTMSGYTIDFPNSVRTRRYDIQASWYNDAILNPTTQFPEGFPDFNREEITMRPFLFIVESSTNPGKPLVFKVTEELMDIGRNGKVNEFTGKTLVKGYNTLFEEYKYYLNTDWREEKVVTDNNGVLEIGWDGITQNYGN